MSKAYVVFVHSDTFEGFWSSDTNLDSIWSEIESAKERVADIANRFIEKLWYEDNSVPGLDYKEEWSKDKTHVKYCPDPYSEYSFYIEEHELRSGWVTDGQNNTDLPAYFTTT